MPVIVYSWVRPISSVHFSSLTDWIIWGMIKQRSKVGLLMGSTNAGMCLFWGAYIVLLNLLLSAQLTNLSFTSYIKVSYKGLALTVICFWCHGTGLLGGSLTENRRTLVVVRNADSAVMLICQHHDNSFVNTKSVWWVHICMSMYTCIFILSFFVHFCPNPTPTLMLFFARYLQPLRISHKNN